MEPTPASRRRGAARAGPGTDEEEGPLLSSDSHSKDPATQRPGPAAPGRARLGLCCRALAVVLAGVAPLALLGYLALFCAFWLRHTQSPVADPAAGIDFRSSQCSPSQGTPVVARLLPAK